MKLNSARLIQSINEKWNSKTCPMCGKNNWTIDEGIVTLVQVDPEKNINIGGKIIPLVACTCSNCGNTVLVNPMVTGALDEV